MPTRSARRPIRQTPSSATGRGGRKVLFFLIAIVLVVLAATYLLLGRGPSGPAGEGTGSGASDAGQVEPAGEPGSGSPQITAGKARLQFESVDNKDLIRVVIDKVAGESGDDILYRFDWTVNGKPAGDGGDSLTGFKRGDRVTVKITPIQGEKTGSSKIMDFLVNNTPPKIADGKEEVKFDGKTFSYQVKGSDQDGDPLSYALEDAPEGMTIDPQTGAIKWQLKDGDYGERTIKVKISDGKGGTATQSIKADLQKPPEQRKPGEDKK